MHQSDHVLGTWGREMKIEFVVDQGKAFLGILLAFLAFLALAFLVGILFLELPLDLHDQP